MLGLSLSKIALTAAVIFAVWYGFKYLGRITGSSKPTGRAPDRPAAAPTVEDLQKCEVCGTYVASDSAPTCDRADCPHA
jgi:hypothetical protein